MKNLELHVLIERERDSYSALCLELDVASDGATAEEARKNVREAILLYLDDVYSQGDEEAFVPRPAPAKEWVKYFRARVRDLDPHLRLAARDKHVVLQEALIG